MSTKLAHATPVVIVATIAAASSISIATASPTGAETHQIPVYTRHHTHHAGYHRAITDPNKIFAGQTLTIPKSGKTYVVQRGDTLSGIAKKFGVSVAALEAANRGAPAHR